MTKGADENEAGPGELAAFLRAMRARLPPRSLGIEPSKRRRAHGLLREEIALAAGISLTWYTWMEQGRPTNPSDAVLGRLADVLRLDPAERRHLFRLARPAPAHGRTGAADDRSGMLEAVLSGMPTRPAYVIDRAWTVLAWNAPAERLLGAFDAHDRVRANVLWRLALDPDWRALFVEWDEVFSSAVEQFRAHAAEFAGDADVSAAREGLLEASADFRTAWATHRVRATPSWRKLFEHPDHGRMAMHYQSLRPEGLVEGVRLIVYAPADDRAAAFLETPLS